jgi:hypothetical protein
MGHDEPGDGRKTIVRDQFVAAFIIPLIENPVAEGMRWRTV